MVDWRSFLTILGFWYFIFAFWNLIFGFWDFGLLDFTSFYEPQGALRGQNILKNGICFSGVVVCLLELRLFHQTFILACIWIISLLPRAPRRNFLQNDGSNNLFSSTEGPIFGVQLLWTPRAGGGGCVTTRVLSWSLPSRTQEWNIPFGGTPHSDKKLKHEFLVS